MRRQRIPSPDGEWFEMITFEAPMSTTKLKEEYIRGNITVEELDQMLPSLLAREEKESRMLARHIPQEGHEVETVVRTAKGVILGSAAIALLFVIFAIVLMGVAGLVAWLVQSI
jgi:hypothetical protein